MTSTPYEPKLASVAAVIADATRSHAQLPAGRRLGKLMAAELLPRATG